MIYIYNLEFKAEFNDLHYRKEHLASKGKAEKIDFGFVRSNLK